MDIKEKEFTGEEYEYLIVKWDIDSLKDIETQFNCANPNFKKKNGKVI